MIPSVVNWIEIVLKIESTFVASDEAAKINRIMFTTKNTKPTLKLRPHLCRCEQPITEKYRGGLGGNYDVIEAIGRKTKPLYKVFNNISIKMPL